MIGSAIYGFLTTDTGVTNLIGDRLYPVVAPQPQVYSQSTIFPYCTYYVQSKPTMTQSGPSGLSRATIQINCWSADYDQSHAVDDAIKVAVSSGTIKFLGYQGYMGAYTISAILQNEPTKDLFFPNAELGQETGFHDCQSTYICWFNLT